MMKSYVILFVVFFTACNRHYYKNANKKIEKAYTFNGKITGMDSGWLYLVHTDTTGNAFLPALDSAKIINGYFVFHGKIPSPEPCKIMFKNEEKWPYTSWFILDTGTTKGELFKDSMPNSIITGDKLQEQFVAFNKKIFDAAVDYEQKALLYKKEAKNTDSLDKAFYRDKYDLLLKEVKMKPSSFVSAYLVERNLIESMTVTDLEEIYNSLAIPNNYYSNHLLQLMNAKRQSSIGMLAPDFKIVDSKNKILTNRSFKGKYLLIDFWASWCPACREENPNLVKAYKKFAGKGFEILSISLDRNQKAWEDAVLSDGLIWSQAYDLKGANSKIVENFESLIIPANFLIDKEGRIINRNLTGETLEKVLQEQVR